MASPKKAPWVKLGSPFTVAAPILYMVHYCVRNKIANLGTIGNENHLNAEPPEDHTPYSDTAWPNRLPLVVAVAGQRYWVCAGDFANDKGLGAAVLRDARAGLLPWLKYMNVGGMHYTFADGFREGRPNDDQHIHLSTFSDAKSLTHVPAGWDPLAGIPPQKGKDMVIVKTAAGRAQYLSDGLTARWLQDGPERDFWVKALGVSASPQIITPAHLARLVIIGEKPPAV